MMSKWSGLAALACAICLSAATARAQVIIGDFEGGNMGGWAATNGAFAYADNTPGYGGEFASQGTSWSLNLLSRDPNVGPPQPGFKWALQLASYAAGAPAGLGALIRDNPILEADVGWRTDEWNTDPDGTWARWDTASLNSDGGWRQTSNPQMIDPANPMFPGSWDAQNWGAIHKRTIRWNLYQASGVDAAYLAQLATSSYVQLNMSINFDSNFNTAGGSFWIDQIRLVPIPEPGTLGLIAVAGVLPVLRRRFSRS